MKKVQIIAVIFLVLILVEARRDHNKNKQKVLLTPQEFKQYCSGFRCDTVWSYSQAVLALSWPGSFCRFNQCVSGWDLRWDGYSFGIHGYWPTYDDEDTSCVKSENKTYRRCPDPFCNYDYYFTTKVEDSPISDLKADLDKYWPEFNKDNEGEFRQNQWNKHGVCYLKRIMQDFKGKYIEQQIFRYYFESSVQKAKLYSKVRRFNYPDKEALAADIGISDPDTFYVQCKLHDGKCYISEIRLCYDIADPGFEVLTKCFEDSLRRERQKIKKAPLALDNPKNMKEIYEEAL